MLKHIRIQLEQAAYTEGLHFIKGLIEYKFMIFYINIA